MGYLPLATVNHIQDIERVIKLPVKFYAMNGKTLAFFILLTGIILFFKAIMDFNTKSKEDKIMDRLLKILYLVSAFSISFYLLMILLGFLITLFLSLVIPIIIVLYNSNISFKVFSVITPPIITTVTLGFTAIGVFISKAILDVLLPKIKETDVLKLINDSYDKVPKEIKDKISPRG